MEIPLQAQVECADGFYGRSVYVLIDPVIENVTHLVVRKAVSPHTEHIVPVNLVSETIAGAIQLCCSRADVDKMPPFIQTRFVEVKIPDYMETHGYGMGNSYFWPHVSPELSAIGSVEVQQIPAGEMSVCRGTRVEATDGFVGRVDELVVNAENDHITHLVMREGHLWGKKEVIIPLSAIRDTVEDTVFLKLNKHQIETLPAFPIRRRWA